MEWDIASHCWMKKKKKCGLLSRVTEPKHLMFTESLSLCVHLRFTCEVGMG